MTFRAHLETLPEAQRHVWPHLAAARSLGFVLYGGTAIALRFGHRTSIDFDFFTERHLERDKLSRDLPFLAAAQILQDEPNTLTVLAASPGHAAASVKVSFFGSLHLGRIGEPDETDDGVLLVASAEDLMATKLKVLLQRVEAKDYLDIATLISGGVSLERGLAGATLMYAPAFAPAECLRALSYFEGGDLNTLPAAVKKTLSRTASTVKALPTLELASAKLQGS